MEMTTREMILDYVATNDKYGLEPSKTLGGIVRTYLQENGCIGLTKPGCASHGCHLPYLWPCQQSSHCLPLDCLAVEEERDEA